MLESTLGKNRNRSKKLLNGTKSIEIMNPSISGIRIVCPMIANHPINNIDIKQQASLI